VTIIVVDSTACNMQLALLPGAVVHPEYGSKKIDFKQFETISAVPQQFRDLTFNQWSHHIV
jgi:hypothetical protein